MAERPDLFAKLGFSHRRQSRGVDVGVGSDGGHRLIEVARFSSALEDGPRRWVELARHCDVEVGKALERKELHQLERAALTRSGTIVEHRWIDLTRKVQEDVYLMP